MKANAGFSEDYSLHDKSPQYAAIREKTLICRTQTKAFLELEDRQIFLALAGNLASTLERKPLVFTWNGVEAGERPPKNPYLP